MTTFSKDKPLREVLKIWFSLKFLKIFWGACHKSFLVNRKWRLSPLNLICLDPIKCVLLTSFFIVLETISLKIWTKPLLRNIKCALPVNVGGSKRPLLKFPTSCLQQQIIPFGPASPWGPSPPSLPGGKKDDWRVIQRWNKHGYHILNLISYPDLLGKIWSNSFCTRDRLLAIWEAMKERMVDL